MSDRVSVRVALYIGKATAHTARYPIGFRATFEENAHGEPCLYGIKTQDAETARERVSKAANGEIGVLCLPEFRRAGVAIFRTTGDNRKSEYRFETGLATLIRQLAVRGFD